MYYGIDSTYIILVLPALLLAMWAQMRVKGTFARYSKMGNRQGLTGAEAARAILDRSGLGSIPVEPVRGQLTDHYDPRSRVVRLSEQVYSSRSVAAIGVAAHECGHAVQHATGYGPLSLRNSSVTVTNFASNMAIPIFFIGLLFNSESFALAGIVLFSFAVALSLVTLPVEYNASSRAMAVLEGAGILDPQELSAARKVLSSAALTYVAATVVSIMTLLRLILLFGGRRRD